MHFGLTQEQELLQESLRRFSAQALPATRLREIFDAGPGFDAAIWQEAAQIGLTGLIVPEAYGGSGLTLLDLALAFEVLGESAMPGPFLGHALASLAVARFASEEQKRKRLPRWASGEQIASFVAPDPARSAQIAGARETPAHTGPGWSIRDGHIRGHQAFVEALPETGVFVIALDGGSLGLVEASAAGVEWTPIERVDRTRPLGDLRLTDARFERLTDAADATAAVVDAGLVLLAADAFGAAWKLIRMTVEYARTRVQFGTPIAQFQAVKHQLADMAMEAEPMRGLVWYAAYAWDQRPDERAREAATAKAHITDRAVQIGRAAIALHGGLGFTWDCDAHFWLKRTMHDRAWLGSPTYHRERSARLSDWSQTQTQTPPPPPKQG